MVRQTPALLRQIYREHAEMDTLIDEYAIDLIISDNRFGLWSKKVPTVFITHQLHLQVPYGEWLANKLNSFFINKYDQVWVPDHEGEKSLAGKLTSTRWIKQHKIQFIGPLSRFQRSESTPEEKYDFIAILSGPEPQRSIFEKMIFSQLKNTGEYGIIVRGLPGSQEKHQLTEEITVYNHLKGDELLNYIPSIERRDCSLWVYHHHGIGCTWKKKPYSSPRQVKQNKSIWPIIMLQKNTL